MMNQSSDFIFAVLFLARYMDLYILFLKQKLKCFFAIIYISIYICIDIYISIDF